MVIRKNILENTQVIEEISWLLKKLHIEYKIIDNYILSFIHRSIVNEKPDFAPTHNERLEFLWDAVLELIITDNLFNDFPDKPEWELTDIRSAIVRWRNLAQISKKLDFSKYLFLWKWEDLWWWRESNYLLANTLEAFIWAIYIDLWIKNAKTFVDKHIYSSLWEIIESKSFKDFKSIIQEFIQSEFDITPTYEVLDESWPDHNKNFEVWIYIWEKVIWKWVWSSKKKAQEQAAKDAYENKDNWANL